MDSEKEKSVNRIGQDFNLRSLVAFTTPSILMQLFTQLFQTLDDGLFVSRYVGEHALAAINLLSPLNFLRMGITNLFSMGASTIAAEKMGEGEQQEAKRVFTKIVIAALVASTLLAVIVNIFAYPICYFVGADETTIDNAIIYVRIVYGLTPVHLLSIVFTSFYSTCGKPKMGLASSIINGATNIILDIILIPIMDLGVVGSSVSTVMGDFLVMLVALVFFSMKKQEIHFVKPDGPFFPTIWKSFQYASSQFVNSLSFSAYNFVANKVILSIAGADGIAANAIVSDLRRILNAAVAGYASCVGPIIAYNCGSQNYKRLKKIINYNVTYWFFASLAVTVAGELLRIPLIKIFFTEGSSQHVFDITLQGLTIEFAGIILTTGCIILNRMFISMNEIKVGTFVSFMRNIVFRIIFTIMLPLMFKMTGVWLSFTVAEVFSFSLGVYFLIKVIPRFGLSAKDLKFDFN